MSKSKIPFKSKMGLTLIEGAKLNCNFTNYKAVCHFEMSREQQDPWKVLQFIRTCGGEHDTFDNGSLLVGSSQCRFSSAVIVHL